MSAKRKRWPKSDAARHQQNARRRERYANDPAYKE